MTVTVDSLRQALPEFLDGAAFPPEALSFWIGIAVLMLPATTWGASSATADVPPTTKLDYATMLFAAHHLVLERVAQRDASRGVPPGMMKGAISADSAGRVSRSYDTSSILDPADGHWNLTVYGIRLAALIRMPMVPMMTFGGTCPAAVPPYSGAPWVGPPPWPGWFG